MQQQIQQHLDRLGTGLQYSQLDAKMQEAVTQYGQQAFLTWLQGQLPPQRLRQPLRWLHKGFCNTMKQQRDTPVPPVTPQLQPPQPQAEEPQPPTGLTYYEVMLAVQRAQQASASSQPTMETVLDQFTPLLLLSTHESQLSSASALFELFGDRLTAARDYGPAAASKAYTEYVSSVASRIQDICFYII